MLLRLFIKIEDLGRALLVKCIKKLYEKNLEEIKLLVITSNDIAVNMYKDMDLKRKIVFRIGLKKNYNFLKKVLYLNNLQIIIKIDTKK